MKTVAKYLVSLLLAVSFIGPLLIIGVQRLFECIFLYYEAQGLATFFGVVYYFVVFFFFISWMIRNQEKGWN